ncbi:MAG TPA: glycosyltransferase family 39 protein [Chthoniobacterales bacterium]|nr:glycosyltransferase family 39 protein [Chthoniobacterales bacterium]
MALPLRQGVLTPANKAFTLSATGVICCLALCKLLIHLYAGRHYGFFIDELYYLACSRHLDWGYVDQPPLIAVITWLVRSLTGDSLPALRLLPAIAGVGEIALTALITRQLGGRRFAQALAALATLVAPGILATSNLLTMNAFEPLFWLGCAALLIQIVKTGNEKLWIWFGVVVGFGIENKYSMLLFASSALLGLLLSPQRRLLASPWIWGAGILAFLIELPNLVWNVQHHFPFLELQANIRHLGRHTPLTPLLFIAEETLSMNPLTLPLWGAGVWFYFGTGPGRQFRVLGWAWLFTAIVIIVLSPRIYYLFPAFPILFAGGAILWEEWLGRPQRFCWKLAWSAALVATGIALAPIAIPVLSPETYIRYTRAMHIGQPAIETEKLGPLPQIFADQFGWEEMTESIAKFYNGLPLTIRLKTAIFAMNYGQAGAIDLFGPRYGLPKAISGHQNYFLWGPRGYTGESIIVMGLGRKYLERNFAEVRKIGTVYHPYSMPYNHFDVFYCIGAKTPLNKAWPRLKHWS